MALISEGKTKRVQELKNDSSLVLIVNKDNISAGDNSRNRRIMAGKGRLTVETSSAVFRFLNHVGIPTAFVNTCEDNENAFIAKKCEMIPIEVVVRRKAFGTYLALNPTVTSGHHFVRPEVEFHVKDDAKHDPLLSLEQLVSKEWTICGLKVDKECAKRMKTLGLCVFEILENCWHKMDYQLADLKVEFGVQRDLNGNSVLLLADIIDNETWRLWRDGDYSKCVDKQTYRKYKEGEVTEEIVAEVRDVFQEVADLAKKVFCFERKSFEFLDKTRVLLIVGENNVLREEELRELLAREYKVEDVKSELKLSEDVLEMINQSFIEVVVISGKKREEEEELVDKMIVPVIDMKEDIVSTGLLIVKHLARKDSVLWSRLRFRQIQTFND